MYRATQEETAEMKEQEAEQIIVEVEEDISLTSNSRLQHLSCSQATLIEKKASGSSATRQTNKTFNNNFPAVQIASKHYSLDADIATGWKPKTKILGPIPINFDSAISDEIVDELTSFGRKYKQRVVYLGFRYESSFKLHQQIKRTYEFKHEGVVHSNFLHMAAYFRKFHANFKSKTNRIFKGMNPTMKKDEQIQFDSNFESGNLDAAIKTGDGEYDLFMRVDSNTRGHVQWFNFTVKNCGKSKVKLHICNFKKTKTMYSRGMKPYIFSSYLQQSKQLGWHQGGENVKFKKKTLSYRFLEDEFTPEQMTFNCLSFEYTFQTEWETVQFAYAPSYTYGDLTELIRRLRQLNKAFIAEMVKKKQIQSSTVGSKKQENKNIFLQQSGYLREEVLCESLGGLDLPLLTITDPSVPSQQKRCVLVSARIHPGESCGSYMMKGFLEFIMSDCEEADELRRNVVFKVIPMLNPDGVTIGNFRTSLCGKDLNRTFKIQNDLLIPEVKAIKDLVIKLKYEWKNRLMFFFDMHGHSIKKNVFLYGPEYEIWETGYYKTRIFPRLLADRTEIFRYYSCLFRIAEFKRTTARAVILRNIPHCYTIEASTGFYYSQEEKRDIEFTTEKYEYMGRQVALTIRDYMELLYEEEASKLERKQRLNELKMIKSSQKKGQRSSNNSRNSGSLKGNNSSNFKSRKIQPTANQSLASNRQTSQSESPAKQSQAPPKQPFSYMSQKARDMIDKIRREEQQRMEEKREGADNDDAHQSDNFSEGGSDSESQSDDLGEEELRKLHQDILESMKEFKEKIGSKDASTVTTKRQYSFKEEPAKKRNPANKPKPVEVIASLRSKVEKLEKNKKQAANNQTQANTTNKKAKSSAGSSSGQAKPFLREDIKLQKIQFTSKITPSVGSNMPLMPTHLQEQSSPLRSHMNSYNKGQIRSSICRLEELEEQQSRFYKYLEKDTAQQEALSGTQTRRESKHHNRNEDKHPVSHVNIDREIVNIESRVASNSMKNQNGSDIKPTANNSRLYSLVEKIEPQKPQKSPEELKRQQHNELIRFHYANFQRNQVQKAQKYQSFHNVPRNSPQRKHAMIQYNSQKSSGKVDPLQLLIKRQLDRELQPHSEVQKLMQERNSKTRNPSLRSSDRLSFKENQVFDLRVTGEQLPTGKSCNTKSKSSEQEGFAEQQEEEITYEGNPYLKRHLSNSSHLSNEAHRDQGVYKNRETLRRYVSSEIGHLKEDEEEEENYLENQLGSEREAEEQSERYGKRVSISKNGLKGVSPKLIKLIEENKR